MLSRLQLEWQHIERIRQHKGFAEVLSWKSWRAAMEEWWGWLWADNAHVQHMQHSVEEWLRWLSGAISGGTYSHVRIQATNIDWSQRMCSTTCQRVAPWAARLVDLAQQHPVLLACYVFAAVAVVAAVWYGLGKLRQSRSQKDCSSLKPGEADRQLRDMIIGLIDLDPKILLSCSEDALLRYLPTIVCIINSLPMWFQLTKKEVIRTLEQRATTSPSVLQNFRFLKYSGWCDPAIYADVRVFDMAHKDSVWHNLVFTWLASSPAPGVPLYFPKDGIALYSPFVAGRRVYQISVEKEFLSNAKPVLVRLSHKFDAVDEKSNNRTQRAEGEHCSSETTVAATSAQFSRVIFKMGDDLRQDMACLQFFQLVNALWEVEGTRYAGLPVEAKYYGCLAVGDKMGFLEFVEDVTPLTSISDQVFTLEQVQRMVATGAGSYMCSHVLGIRDRHSDNILVSSDGSLFHIDFGYILGNAVALDTAQFAVTPELQSAFVDLWPDFVETVGQAFTALRKHEGSHGPNFQNLVIQSAVAILAPLVGELKVREYLQKSLLLELDLEKAMPKIRRMVETGPSALRTRLKNTLHEFAISRKQRGRVNSVEVKDGKLK